MPTAKFAVEVSVRDTVGDSNSPSKCTADASKYLAYADQTDTFGYHGAIESVTCTKKHRNAYGSVLITFSAPVAQEEDIECFLDECETLARVETVECLTNPGI
jgi:hypothetical protein